MKETQAESLKNYTAYTESNTRHAVHKVIDLYLLQ